MKKIGRRCFVPLRVPVCTLTEHCSRAVPRSFNSKAIVLSSLFTEGRILAL